MGALKQGSRTREAHRLRVAYRKTSSSFWKFYLGYTVYRVPLDLLSEAGNVPERIIEELSFGERRMLHYLAGHKSGTGCCYIRQHGQLTKRFLALEQLVRKYIVKLSYCNGNIVYFKLADPFSKQQKFNIHTCRYSFAAGLPTQEEPRSFLKIIAGIFF